MKLHTWPAIALFIATFTATAPGGTLITNHLPANTAIINIDAKQDGAATYNGDQSLWYQPFYTGGATQLLSCALSAGTYTFRIIDAADAAQAFPSLTTEQTNQIFSSWSYNSPWITDYLIFGGASATDNAIPQLFDGSPDSSAYSSANEAYRSSVLAGYYNLLRTGPAGRKSNTLTNSYTFASNTNLIFTVPDTVLSDNHGGVSVLIAPAGSPTNSAIKFWTGAADQNWFNANNWSPVGVPATNDLITVFTTGTINLTAPVTISGTLTWSSGTFAGQPITISSNGRLNLTGSATKFIQNVLTNSGTVAWLDGNLAVQNSGTTYFGGIENLAGGSWQIQCNQNLYNYNSNTGYFHNAGDIQKFSAAGTTTISVMFKNAGNVAAQTGTINFNSDSIIEGSFNANAGAAIRFNSGAFSYNTPPILNGTGAIQFTGGSLTLRNDVIPNLQMTGGTISLSPEFQGGVITNLTLNGSTLSGSYVVAGTLGSADGVAGSLVVTNGGVLNWTGGNITGPLEIQSGAIANWSGGTAVNVVNVRNNGAMNLIGNNTKYIQNVLTNAGTITWLGGDFAVYNYSGGYSGAVENLSSGLWDIQCDRNLYNGYSAPTHFNNAGSVQKTAGTGTTTFSIAFNNAGTVTAQTGTIRFNGGGTMESVFNANASAAIHFNGGAFSYSAVPILNGPGAIQFTGGSLTLLNDVIPNLQIVGGTIHLAETFQGGTITNLNFGGSLSGDYTVSGTLTLGDGDSGTLTLLNGSVLNWNGGNLGGLVLNGGATVNWSNGTLLGSLDLVSNAVVNWSGGTAANIVNIRTNGMLNLLGNNTKFIQNVLTNAGTVTWLGGDFAVYNYSGGYSGAVESLSSGLWDIQCDRNLYNGYSSPTHFNNAGSVQKTAGTGTTTFSIAFNNAGTVTAQTGTIRFNGGGTMESVFNANDSAAIHFNGGAFSYSTVPILNGPGAIQLTGGSLTLLNDVIPNLQIVGGTIHLAETFQGGTITNLNFGGSLSGDYTVSGTLTLGDGDSGTLTLLNGSVLNWNGGNLGGLVLNGGATVNWSNGTLLGSLDLVSNAVVNWSGGTAANVVKHPNERNAQSHREQYEVHSKTC